MNNFKSFLTVLALAVALCASAFGQTALTQTTLNGALSKTGSTAVLTSVTGVSVGSFLYIVDYGNIRGELVRVSAVNTTTNRVTLNRGSQFETGHVSGARVIIAPTGNAFYTYNPQGACTATATAFTPWINTETGEQWLCSTVTNSWVPGFGAIVGTRGVTATVASAAGPITPSGPLFTVSGTAAITGFTQPIGYAGAPFCIIPSGIFTTTAAGNIAVASTAVVGRQLCYSYNSSTDKFTPSY